MYAHEGGSPRVMPGTHTPDAWQPPAESSQAMPSHGIRQLDWQLGQEISEASYSHAPIASLQRPMFEYRLKVVSPSVHSACGG